MANEYLYGAYGHIGETVAQSAVQAGTTPVYIGTAPVNLVRGFGEAGIINAPIKITSLVDAQKKIGYSSDWGTFTLCEAVYAHFNNTLGNIGPIYVINVLDPSAGKHRKETATTKTLIFTGGIAYGKETIDAISEMVSWIAPITVYPGEDELLALAQGALRVLKGEEKAQEYRRPRPEDNN